MKKSREDRIKITEERRQHLILERARTKVSEYSLIKKAKHVPEGLYHQNLEKVLKGELEWMQIEFFHFVMREWAYKKTVVKPSPDMLLPDYDWKTGKRKAPVRYITQADLLLLESELERTGVMWRVLLRFIPGRPKQLNATLLSNLRNKRRKAIKEEHWQMVINALKAIPDKS